MNARTKRIKLAELRNEIVLHNLMARRKNRNIPIDKKKVKLVSGKDLEDLQVKEKKILPVFLITDKKSKKEFTKLAKLTPSESRVLNAEKREARLKKRYEKLKKWGDLYK